MDEIEPRKAPDGTWHEFQMGRWRPMEGPSPDDYAKVEQYRNESPGLGIGQGVMDMLGGDYWAPGLLGMTDNEYQASKNRQMQDTPKSVMTGSIGTGLVTGALGGMGVSALGMGTLPTVAATTGVEGALGALADTENPLRGGLIGAGLGAAFSGAGPAWQGARNYVGGGNRMAGRVLDNITPIPEAERVMPGIYTADEFAAKGYPLSRSDQLAVNARKGTDELAQADLLRAQEAYKANDVFFGSKERSIFEARDQVFHNRLAREVGTPEDALFTNTNIGNRFNQVGDVLDDYARQVGEVDLNADAVMQMDDILETAHIDNQAWLGKMIESIKDAAQKNGGFLDGNDLQRHRTKLRKMLEAGSAQGDTYKMGDASRLQEALDDLVEESIEPAMKARTQLARYQYGLLKDMRAGKSISDGRVNYSSFAGRRFKKDSRLRNRYAESFERELESVMMLRNRAPNSGTINNLTAIQRLQANPTGELLDRIPGAKQVVNPLLGR